VAAHSGEMAPLCREIRQQPNARSTPGAAEAAPDVCGGLIKLWAVCLVRAPRGGTNAPPSRALDRSPPIHPPRQGLARTPPAQQKKKPGGVRRACGLKSLKRGRLHRRLEGRRRYRWARAPVAGGQCIGQGARPSRLRRRDGRLGQRESPSLFDQDSLRQLFANAAIAASRVAS
jgi:hypothetical protein